MDDLVEFWRRCDLDRPPYIHIDDKPYIDAAVNIGKTMLPSHRAFVEHSSFGDENDSSLHLSLLPVPYQGNLSQADIFIVMLNPGLGLSDYQTEEDQPHADQIRKIIRQDLADVKYPFLSLNPDYAWTGGFQWWEKKLRKVIKRVAKDHCDGSYAAALYLLSQRMAAIEIFPYHSRVFKAASLRAKLPSADVAKSFVQRQLPRAQRGEVSIIVSRGVKTVGISDHELANYDPKLARGAALGPGTPGGSAIINALKTRPPR